MYTYRAHFIRAVDGDTVDLDVDLGFYLKACMRFRLLGVDTYELRGGTDETKALARQARDFVEDRLGNASKLVVETFKADSFGRWLARIWYPADDGGSMINLADELIAHELGVPA